MINKFTVGLQQKIGQPNFGSVGASCSVEVQLDDDEARDADAIAARVKHAFDRCRQSVAEELQHHDCESATAFSASAVHRSEAQQQATDRPRAATEAQVRAIRAIASKHGIALASELHDRFGVRSPNQLTLSQASELIDVLKASPTPA